MLVCLFVFWVGFGLSEGYEPIVCLHESAMGQKCDYNGGRLEQSYPIIPVGNKKYTFTTD